MSYSLAHVESEADVLFLGEEQDEKVITCLTLLDGRIQTDLLRRHKNDIQGEKSVRRNERNSNGKDACLGYKNVDLRQRTSASGPCVAAGTDGARWCRGSCSQRSYRGGEGKSGRYGCRI